MSYKKLIIKPTASVEIEEAISHYTTVSKTLSKKLEK
jgi:hypothetical protein